MGHEELLRALEEEGEREREEILETARREAEEIVAEAEKKAARVKGDFIRRLVTSRESERARRLNRARKESKEILLKSEHEIVSRLFQEVEDRFHSIENYEMVVGSLFQEAVRCVNKEIGEEACHIYLSMRDLDIIKELVKPEECHCMLIPLDDVTCGVVVSRADGRAKYINTLSSRLERAKMGVLPMVRNRLFEEG